MNTKHLKAKILDLAIRGKLVPQDSSEGNAADLLQKIREEKSEAEATKKIVDIIQDPDVDVVVNSISGSAGLVASFETLKASKCLALANKESLVVGGDLLIPMAKNNLLPIDSEHGAIFQCLTGEEKSNINKIHLTASGGPFYGKTKEELENVTSKDALKHPT